MADVDSVTNIVDLALLVESNQDFDVAEQTFRTTGWSPVVDPSGGSAPGESEWTAPAPQQGVAYVTRQSSIDDAESGINILVHTATLDEAEDLQERLRRRIDSVAPVHNLIRADSDERWTNWSGRGRDLHLGLHPPAMLGTSRTAPTVQLGVELTL